MEWDDGDSDTTTEIFLSGPQASAWELVDLPKCLMLRLGKKGLAALFRGSKTYTLNTYKVRALDCVLGPVGLVLKHFYFMRDDEDKVPIAPAPAARAHG